MQARRRMPSQMHLQTATSPANSNNNNNNSSNRNNMVCTWPLLGEAFPPPNVRPTPRWVLRAPRWCRSIRFVGRRGRRPSCPLTALQRRPNAREGRKPHPPPRPKPLWALRSPMRFHSRSCGGREGLRPPSPSTATLVAVARSPSSAPRPRAPTGSCSPSNPPFPPTPSTPAFTGLSPAPAEGRRLAILGGASRRVPITLPPGRTRDPTSPNHARPPRRVRCSPKLMLGCV